ncbi:hypothetical protein MASR2M47_24860 [Draconibacterium sp.]
MGDTAKVHFEGNVVEAHVGINKQFFYTFNSLHYNILFNGSVSTDEKILLSEL